VSNTILAQNNGNWVEITLNRPDRLNSFNDEMHLALRAALETARDTGARCVLITGAGRGFCAGQDLGDRDPSKMQGKPDLSKTVRTFYAPLVNLIRSLDFPVICAVNGVAAGAGANVALACDVVLAAVAERHANGHGICHGGITFALADSAFAFACNSRNQSTVAQHNMISYLAPGRLGDVLTATATELSLTGRSGIYDVKVTNQNAIVIAEFRGFSRAIKGQLFEE
jgi:phenylacetic acid degradation protein PaaD